MRTCETRGVRPKKSVRPRTDFWIGKWAEFPPRMGERQIPSYGAPPAAIGKAPPAPPSLAPPAPGEPPTPESLKNWRSSMVSCAAYGLAPSGQAKDHCRERTSED